MEFLLPNTILAKQTRLQASHVSPKLSEVHWALCVPSLCTAGEVAKVFGKKLRDVISDTTVIIDVEIRSDMCQIIQTNFYSQFNTGFLISV
jgi:hypothetical protein